MFTPTSPTVSTKLSRLQALAVYLFTLGLFITGGGWLALHYFSPLKTPFGGAQSPVEGWLTRLHGGVGMLFLVLFGNILSGHIIGGLRKGENMVSAVLLLMLTVFMVVTGWGLYYFSDEMLRKWTSAAHWAAGIAGVAALAAHVAAGRAAKPFQPKPDPQV